MFIRLFSQLKALFLIFILLLFIANYRIYYTKSITYFNSIKTTFLNEISSSKIERILINQCTDEQSKQHGDLYASFPSVWSSCYNDFYLSAFENHSKSVEILFDVGANKAYAVATWLAFFQPELNINQAHLGKYIQAEKGLSESCGSCEDCKDEPLKRIDSKRKYKLQIHAFEPQPGTVDILKDIKTWMNITWRKTLTFDIHPMAVNEQSGEISFRKCNPGNEVCSLDISQAGKDEQIMVKSVALDDFVRNYNLSEIDILKIDTEGYEPSVFQGAKQLLQQHRIRLFIFEHLAGGAWNRTLLEKEISNLSQLGYVCYMIGKTGLIRVSYCWNNQFDTPHNNILCVSSRDIQLLNNIDQFRLPKTIKTTLIKR